MADTWKLRCELHGHEQDVRAICAFSDSTLATCSRDKSIRVWEPIDGRDFASKSVLLGHEHFIATVIELPPCAAHPTGAILSAGYDRTMSGQTIVKPVINIWEGSTIVGVLEGHTLTVCGLALTPSGQLVSVSWDKTVRVWDLSTRQCTAVLAGHEAAVWDVLCLEDGSVLTASADKTVKRWRGAVCEHTYKGHTDCVRALALVSGIGFLSTGNDGVIILWDLAGGQLLKLTGHDSFVYSLAVLPTGEIVSGSEDKMCKVWRDGKCVASIAHAGSVWGVTALPNGDIATACSDCVARVFSRVPERFAEADTLQAYEGMLASQTISAQEVGGVKLADLPGLEVLEQPGDKDGATKIVRVDQKAFAYAWNGGESKWEQIGTVVEGPGGPGAGAGGGSGGPGELNGKQYDKVFDVEVEAGVTLKCGYNLGQNPYSVAQEFIWDNDLEQAHLDEIARWIDTQANQGVTLGEQAGGGYDPLTGANNAMNEAGSSGQSGGAGGVISFGSDQHIPKKIMTFFETPGKREAIEKKLGELNEALRTNPDGAVSALAMTPEELAVLKETMTIAFSKDSARPPQAVYALISDKLLNWPKASVFPVLDVLRLLVLNPYAAKAFSAATGNFLPAVAALCQGAPDQVPPPTRIMAIRLFANCFRNADMRALIAQHCAGVLAAAKGSGAFANAQVHAAYGALLLNVAVQSKGSSGGGIPADAVVAAVNGAAEFLHTPSAVSGGSEDGIFWVMAALGTLVHENPSAHAVAVGLQVKGAAGGVAGAAQGKVR
eukprot:CAMPEP_0180122658 /NCGR_PEP_ID=MMETSP0986-20121125/3691_1 /TAXON_ID=697907 /ORGANISM="non described non described, Strain CCMP2293" /LENGTH=774 /DNA_ID=CAMNT_0022061857 /DNA_START=102 /DNA_END=2422 /DNA_ORIENTATION=+